MQEEHVKGTYNGHTLQLSHGVGGTYRCLTCGRSFLTCGRISQGAPCAGRTPSMVVRVTV